MNKLVESLKRSSMMMNPKKLLSSSKNNKQKSRRRQQLSARSEDQLSYSNSSISSSSTSSSDDGGGSSFTAKKAAGSVTPQSVLLPTDDDRLYDGNDHIMINNGGCAGGGFQLVHAFKLIDRDGDGKISIAELEPILSRVVVGGQAHIITKDEVAAMLSDLDTDGDGFLSLDEFRGAFLSSSSSEIAADAAAPQVAEEELRDTFDFFDMNRDGRITAEELLEGFIMIGDEGCTLSDCRRMIAEVDVNKDGYVCFDDFSRMMDQTNLAS